MDLPEAREPAPEQAGAVRRRLLSAMLADPPLVAAPTAQRRTGGFVAGAVLVCMLVGAGLAAAVAITLTAAHRSATDTVSAGPSCSTSSTTGTASPRTTSRR